MKKRKGASTVSSVKKSENETRAETESMEMTGAGEEMEEAETSACDASFRAEDAVPTSGHDTVSQCTESQELFLKAVRDHHDKSCEFDFEESLGTLTPDEVTALWGSLHKYISAAETDKVSETIAAVSLIARLSANLDMINPDFIPAGLSASAVILHNLVPGVKEAKTTSNICYFLETWYSRNLLEKDSVILNVLTILLRKSLGPQAAKADIKRIWSLHQTVMEHPVEEGQTLHNLLVATVGSSLYLTTPEGVRWLVFLLSLSPDLVTRLHKQARGCLASLSKAACLGLGEVYHKAWVASGGEFRERLEQDCIQDIMYRGVLASRDRGGVAVNVTRVLSYLRSQERSQATQNLLARLYEPILWRHLKVANPNVRLNACELFLANYPLEDHERGREERDSSLEMQHGFMLSLLRDEDVRVRSEAVRGVCRALASYWLLIPGETINQIINIVFKELIWDNSSPRVRMVSLAGISTILSSPHSHVYMKAVLPRLSECLHDTNEGVRAALIDLLQIVKGLKSLKFWNICPVEHLLARLEKDKAFVCRRITKLLYNSYFPKNQTEEVTLQRCIHMIKMNRAATRRFYQYASEILDVEPSLVFMLNILTSVKNWVKAKTRSGSVSSLSEDDKENVGKKRRKLYSNSESSVMEDSNNTESSTVLETTAVNSTTAGSNIEENVAVDEDHPYNDMNVVEGVLDIVCVIWRSKIADICKPENDEMRSALEKKAGKWMLLFFKYFKNTPVINTVVFFSSFLPERSVSVLASFCLARVKEDENWKIHADCLCNWRKGNNLLELVTETIDAVLAGGKKHSNTKGVRFEEPIAKDSKIKVALKLVKYLLDHQANRAILLAKSRPMMEELLTSCSSVQDYVTRRLGFTDKSGVSGSDVAEIISLYGQLVIILHPDTAITRAEELLTWSEAELLPVLEARDIGEARSRDHVSVARQVLAAVTRFMVSVTCLGLADPALADRCLDWSLQLVTEAGADLVPAMLTVLAVTAETASHRDSEAWRTQFQEKVPVGFAKLLRWITGNFAEFEQEEDNVQGFKQGVSSLIRTYHKERLKEPDSWEDLIDVTVASVIAIMTKRVAEEGEVIVDKQSKVVNTTIEAVIKIAGATLIGEAMTRMIKGDTEDSDNAAHTLAAYLGLITIVNSNNSKDAIIDYIEDFSKKQLDLKEEGESSRTFLEEIRSIALSMKAK